MDALAFWIEIGIFLEVFCCLMPRVVVRVVDRRDAVDSFPGVTGSIPLEEYWKQFYQRSVKNKIICLKLKAWMEESEELRFCLAKLEAERWFYEFLGLGRFFLGQLLSIKNKLGRSASAKCWMIVLTSCEVSFAVGAFLINALAYLSTKETSLSIEGHGFESRQSSTNKH